MSRPPLDRGYHAVPAGSLATVVTCLDMRTRPAPPPGRLAGDLAIERWTRPDIAAYRALFRAIGADWLWASRLVMGDDELAGILGDDRVEVYRLLRGPEALGLVELDFRAAGVCELAFFGLVPSAIGQGAGRALMDFAIARAWDAPIARFWVHTCHFDHPAALGFYCRSGFTPYATMIEVMDDPRLSGALPREAARHVPIIEA